MKVQTPKIALKDIKAGMNVRVIGLVTNLIGEVLSCEPIEDARNRWCVVYQIEDGRVITHKGAGHGKMELH